MLILSIIVPCYNQAQYLDECLQSVLNQNFIDWECIIVNDGSTDNTSEIAHRWIEKDNRFRYVFTKNSGLSNARNAGIKIALGEYILPLDADDKISILYSSLAMSTFENDRELKLVYCKAEKFGEVNESWILPEFSLINLTKQNMIFCSAFFKKEDWERVGGYDVKMLYGLEDWEFWIAILKNGGRVKCLNEVGFFYRIKKESMLNSINQIQKKYLFEYISIKHADLYVSFYGTFLDMHHEITKIKSNFSKNINSEKFIINLFCRKFFAFTPFKKKNNKFK